MKNIPIDLDTRNAVVDAGTKLLGDAIVGALKRPDVAAAVRAIFFAHTAPTASATSEDGLLSKRKTAKALDVSCSTIDRLVREGMPVAAHVGDGRRFDLVACRAWLAARGKKPTKSPKTSEGAENINDVIEAAGLRAP